MKSWISPSIVVAGLLVGLPVRGQAPAGALTVEYVAANPSLWPKQVITKSSVAGNMQLAGKPSVPVMVRGDEMLKLVRVEGGNVIVEIAGATVVIPAASTDLLSGAATNRARLSGVARPVATASAAAPLPGERVLPAGMRESAPSYRHALGDSLRTGLVGMRENVVQPAAGEDVSRKKYVALYFSAHWCGPCRQFTPRLVDFYNGHRRDADKFEVVFVSSDHSAKDMANYMREAQMPWLAVDYAQRDVIARLKQQFAGPGIPCLVVIDESGRVVSNSYEGKNYLGPNKVLADLGRLLDQG
jgi:nucleoredoxin